MEGIITSYAECEELWRTCRNKAAGKPITSYVRMSKQTDGSFLFFMDRFGTTGSIFSVSSDDTLTTLASTKSHRLLSYIPKLTPISISYISFQQRVAHISGSDRVYAAGLQVNMVEQKFLNGVTRSGMLSVIDEDKATEWRMLLRKFRAMAKARQALGGFDLYTPDIVSGLITTFKTTNVSALDTLYIAIVNCCISDATIGMLIIDGGNWRWRNSKIVPVDTEYSIRKHSVGLRRLHGCIAPEWSLLVGGVE